MKYINEPSAKTAMSWGHLVDEFEDEVNKVTKVSKDDWKAELQMSMESPR